MLGQAPLSHHIAHSSTVLWNQSTGFGIQMVTVAVNDYFLRICECFGRVLVWYAVEKNGLFYDIFRRQQPAPLHCRFKELALVATRLW